MEGIVGKSPEITDPDQLDLFPGERDEIVDERVVEKSSTDQDQERRIRSPTPGIINESQLRMANDLKELSRKLKTKKPPQA